MNMLSLSSIVLYSGLGLILIIVLILVLMGRV